MKPLFRRGFLRAMGVCTALAVPGRAAPRPIIAGAIRWDAWYADTGPPREAQDTLGYPPWQGRAPWFAKRDGPNHITAVGTQADMDEECRVAAAYGLSYWAFVMYAEDSPMSVAWHLYQASANQHMVNWCGIVGPGFLGNDPFRSTGAWQAKDDAWVRYFAQPEYQKLEGNRPLLYLLWSDFEIGAYFGGDLDNFAASLRYLRARCGAAGVGNPYIVIMAGKAAHSAEILRAVGADAISDYIPDMGQPPAGAVPWRELDARTQAFWASEAAQGVECIPIATTGWDTRARREHPESWTHQKPAPNPQNYFVLPTPAQLRTHLAVAIAFVDTHKQSCRSQSLLIYSWDECDEGGNGMIPTLERPPTSSVDNNIMTLRNQVE